MPPAPESQVPATWEELLEAHARTIFHIARLFTDTYDDRMDLFLFVCERLRRGGMRRVRSFRYRPDAPCRFSTYLSVVVKNIAIDYIRAREGRFRPFRSLAALDAVDQLLFEYHLRDGLPLEESRRRLERSHGIRLPAREAEERASRLQTALSSSQRWRLLSRLAASRRPLPIDPVADVALASVGEAGELRAVPLPGQGGDPERPLRAGDADRVLREALDEMPPRRRLAFMLRYRDELPARLAGDVMNVTGKEAERLAREALDEIRVKLDRCRITRQDLESSGFPLTWLHEEMGR